MNQVNLPQSSHEYLVEMSFPPFGSLLSPAELAFFGEQFVLPTLEACRQHQRTGRIVAGGTIRERLSRGQAAANPSARANTTTN